MPFETQSRTQIRDAGLGYLTARFNAISKRISTVKNSFSYMLFDVLGLLLEGMQSYASSLADQALPDRATGTLLQRHGAIDGVFQKSASTAIIQANITGTALATVTFGSARLQGANGLAYQPCDATGAPITSTVLTASGNAVIHLRCLTTGSTANLNTGVVLQWTNTPTNANATASVVVIYKMRLTGTASAVITFGASKLRSSTNNTYVPVDVNGASVSGVTLDGSGNADVYFKADTSGINAVVGSGATFTWTVTPGSLNSTATVLSGHGPIAGADAESESEYRERVLARRRDRPGSGNCADWKSWSEEVVNVKEAYVYSNYYDNAGSTPYAYPLYGALTVCIVGEAPSPPFDGTTDRFLTSADVARVRAYIEGTQDAQGNLVQSRDQVMLRPATVSQNDYNICIPQTYLQDIDITITLSGVAVPTWSASTFTVGAGCTTTLLANLSTNPITLGVKSGDWIGVRNPSIRGWYEYVRVESMTTTSITLASDTPLLVAPASGRTVRPASSNAAAVRDAILDTCARLGPTTPTGGVTRWPAESTIGPSTLYRSSIIAAVISLPGVPGAPPGVSGVVNASLTTPAADVTLSSNYIRLILPQEIIIRVQ